MAKPSFKAPSRTHYDVVIVGGGVVGASVAYWLAEREERDLRVLVVERDPTYRFSSTALSASSIRQQFSNPVNVEISRFGMEIVRSFAERMAPFHVGETPPDLGFREHGYLYCHSPAGVEAAKARVSMQRDLGAQTIFLDPGALLERFPYLNVEDLGGASFGSQDEGWFDSMGLLNGFRRAAKAMGVEFLENEVEGLGLHSDRVRDVRLATGQTVSCGVLVNAAGPRARQVAQMAGLELPVEPRRRDCFVFASANAIPGRMPLIIDLSGTYVRPEGDLFLTGRKPDEDGPAAYDDFETALDTFEERIWPDLYHRIPAFEALRMLRGWSGHYEYNTLDQNGVVGFHPQVANFIFANGFSGHGLQQAPAVGRGVAELVLDGAFRTLDLSPLGYGRVVRGEPFLEEAVI